YTSLLLFLFLFLFFCIQRKRNATGKLRNHLRVSNSDSSKKANLSAARKERVKLDPDSHPNGGGYEISDFLSHSSGIQAILNTAPVLDLRVTPTHEDCTIEMLSCKLQGSEVIEDQNDRFSAFMVNRMTWDTDNLEPFLEVDVKLNLTLEIYTQPFLLLPTSAVEGPGNLHAATAE
ncbi:hypothetical protein LINPERPRIM_LOCUS11130, partial [Linum perenne]